MRRFYLFFLILLLLLLVPTTYSANLNECFKYAGKSFRVSPILLKCIGTVESGLNQNARNKNSDGTIDVGIMQINSSWIKTISRSHWVKAKTDGGYAFVQVGTVMDVFQEIAKAEGQDYATNDKALRKSILLKISNIMRQNGYFATDLAKEGYLGGYFTIKFAADSGKKDMKGYYMPFLTKAFGDMTEIEARKKGTILDKMVKIAMAKD